MSNPMMNGNQNPMGMQMMGNNTMGNTMNMYNPMMNQNQMMMQNTITGGPGDVTGPG